MRFKGFEEMTNKRIDLFHIMILTVLVMSLMTGPAVASEDTSSGDTNAQIPFIEKIRIYPTANETLLVIANSSDAAYTSYGMTDPPRVIIDINGLPQEGLQHRINVDRGHIKTIRLEEDKDEKKTRVSIELTDMIDYQVSDFAKTIKLTLLPTKPIQKSEFLKKETSSSKQKAEAGDKYQLQEPRVAFKPKPDGNQILGVDFTMVDGGRSLLTISTNRKTPYDLDRIGEKGLLLKLPKTTIPDLLLRPLDATHFHGALEKVLLDRDDKTGEVSMKISLKELVPFHVKQTDDAISIEFGRTQVKPPEKKIIPLNLAQATTKPSSIKEPERRTTTGQAPPVSARRTGKKYKGEPMYLDFADADVTNILRLINEISKENIIWDPAIAGRKVSMILKGVPWDEALDLILKNNDLAKRYLGKNIIWITTKAKMNQILAEEEAEELKRIQRAEEMALKKAELEKKKKEDEPLFTEYIPVDFAAAADIKTHIVISKRGTMSIDTRTNTIILKDTASVIEEAKKTVRQFDTPVKQIMIEARIVDATDTFNRDLGVEWLNNGIAYQRRSNTNVTWSGQPLWAVSNSEASFPSGGSERIGGSFTTNTPSGWSPNLDLHFARLSGDMLAGIGLDAALALAESEGKAKIISAPKVIAREGTAASISSGDSIIIDATENVASTTLDATLSLTVTPTAVSYNNFITMDVAVTDDQAALTNDRLLRKAINTTLMVQSGETVVIGGIIKENKSENESGVPIMKDIPGIGWIFKAQRKVHSKSELLIFLTPTVLPTPTKPL